MTITLEIDTHNLAPEYNKSSLLQINELPDSQDPQFTRYLYERRQVQYSLQMALMDKKREESLFWAYELYHSGFKDEVWQFVIEIYLQHYATYNPRFRTRLDSFYAEWQKTNDVCLLGTVVGTLACWDCDKREDKKQPTKKFLILYKEDRHQTILVTYPARKYLQQVSKFPIRIQTTQNAELLRPSSFRPQADKGAPAPFETPTPQNAELLLRQNWLYYCAKTPIWMSRIKEGRGFIQETTQTVEFNTDDDLEEFYDKWGFEPDEQSMEMHRIHGIYPPLISSSNTPN